MANRTIMGCHRMPPAFLSKAFFCSFQNIWMNEFFSEVSIMSERRLWAASDTCKCSSFSLAWIFSSSCKALRFSRRVIFKALATLAFKTRDKGVKRWISLLSASLCRRCFRRSSRLISPQAEHISPLRTVPSHACAWTVDVDVIRLLCFAYFTCL